MGDISYVIFTLRILIVTSEKIQTIIAQAKGIEMIVSGMLCDMTDPELQAYGCAALWNVCFKNGNVCVWLECGLLPSILCCVGTLRVRHLPFKCV